VTRLDFALLVTLNGSLNPSAICSCSAPPGGDEDNMAHKITEDCLACGACVDECPNEAISEGDDIYVIDPDLCDDCGTCVEACPSEAIIPG
jgi:ferredoxin